MGGTSLYYIYVSFGENVLFLILGLLIFIYLNVLIMKLNFSIAVNFPIIYLFTR